MEEYGDRYHLTWYFAISPMVPPTLQISLPSKISWGLAGNSFSSILKKHRFSVLEENKSCLSIETVTIA